MVELNQELLDFFKVKLIVVVDVNLAPQVLNMSLLSCLEGALRHAEMGLVNEHLEASHEVPHCGSFVEDYLYLVFKGRVLLLADHADAELLPTLQLLFLPFQSLCVLCSEEDSLHLGEVDPAVFGLLLFADPLEDLSIVGEEHEHAGVELAPAGDTVDEGPVDHRVEGGLLVDEVEEGGRESRRPGRGQGRLEGSLLPLYLLGLLSHL